MSYWLRMVVLGLVAVVSAEVARGQTRIGPVDVRVEKPAEDSEPKEKVDVSASDKPRAGEGEITIGQMKRMFLELEHPDPRLRERAREKMMGLKRADLKMLAQVVEEFRPLEGQMVGLIKEIVTHVWLTEDDYEKEPRGFLGISMPRQGDVEDRMQVIVEERMPGFGGFATLRDGDVILDVVEQPLPQPLDRDIFIDVIKAMKPQRTVHLKVLRQGTVRVVAVKVSARPAEKAVVNALAYEGKVKELIYRRSQDAEKFWKEEFGKAIEGNATVGSAGKD